MFFFDESNSFYICSYFFGWQPKEHSCEVCLKLAKWYMSLKQIVDDTRRRRTLTDPEVLIELIK